MDRKQSKILMVKWIHINSVAPFKTFRSKIRKWKKLNVTKEV